MSRNAGVFRVLVGIAVAVTAVGLLGFAGLRWIRPSGKLPAIPGSTAPAAGSRALRGMRAGPGDALGAGMDAGMAAGVAAAAATASAGGHGAAEDAARDAADRFIRIRLRGAAAAATVGEVQLRNRGDGTFVATVAVSVPDGTGVRRQQYDLRIAPGDEAGGEAMIVSLDRAPVTLTDAEWARLDRALQQRATDYIRDTTYGEHLGVQVHATPLGRGRYDVVALIPDTAAPAGRRTAFLIATFDPGSDGWTVVPAP